MINPFVVYKSFKDGHICVRPLEMFSSKVDHEKYPNVRQVYRFEVIDKKAIVTADRDNEISDFRKISDLNDGMQIISKKCAKSDGFVVFALFINRNKYNEIDHAIMSSCLHKSFIRFFGEDLQSEAETFIKENYSVNSFLHLHEPLR